jgi:hypothetical protein
VTKATGVAKVQVIRLESSPDVLWYQSLIQLQAEEEEHENLLKGKLKYMLADPQDCNCTWST